MPFCVAIMYIHASLCKKKHANSSLYFMLLKHQSLRYVTFVHGDPKINIMSWMWPFISWLSWYNLKTHIIKLLPAIFLETFMHKDSFMHAIWRFNLNCKIWYSVKVFDLIDVLLIFLYKLLDNYKHALSHLIMLHKFSFTHLYANGNMSILPIFHTSKHQFLYTMYPSFTGYKHERNVA